MAFVTKIFEFDSLEGWYVESATAASPGLLLELDPFTNSPASSGGGCLRISAFNETDMGDAKWEWSGSFVDMGVPAGQVIKSIQANLYYMVEGYNGLFSNYIGQLDMFLADMTAIATLVSPHLYFAGTDWTQLFGSLFNPSGITSDTPLVFRVAASANNSFASNSYSIFYDRIEFFIEYGQNQFVQVVIC
jgi:hypothetical protein